MRRTTVGMRTRKSNFACVCVFCVIHSNNMNLNTHAGVESEGLTGLGDAAEVSEGGSGQKRGREQADGEEGTMVNRGGGSRYGGAELGKLEGELKRAMRLLRCACVYLCLYTASLSLCCCGSQVTLYLSLVSRTLMKMKTHTHTRARTKHRNHAASVPLSPQGPIQPCSTPAEAAINSGACFLAYSMEV